jgi:hypothetical protein
MKSKETVLYRHGDVLLRSIIELPKGLKVLSKPVVAEGTVTGHTHRFKESKVRVYKSKDNKLYVVNTLKIANLIHEEHNTIKIPKGIYEVIEQREYDLLEGVRTVLD